MEMEGDREGERGEDGGEGDGERKRGGRVKGGEGGRDAWHLIWCLYLKVMTVMVRSLSSHGDLRFMLFYFFFNFFI